MNPPPPDLYNKALEDYRQNRLIEAESKLKKIVCDFPDFMDAYEALSVVLYNQKKYDKAIDVIRRWIEKAPEAIMAHTNLSRCYVAKGMIAEAEQAQAESRRLSWKAELTSKKQQVPPKADYQAQIEKYKKVIEFDPSDVLGYFSLGSVFLEAGNHRDAADTFDKAIHVDPGHSSSYLGLGNALEALGDKSRAKEIYRKGMQIAEARGDMIPLKKMESRLNNLEGTS